MQISPDEIILWRFGAVSLNGTILFTWIIMALLTVGSWLVTRRLSTDAHPARWQNILEAIVSNIQKQLKEITRKEPERFLPFLGTMFLFIAL